MSKRSSTGATNTLFNYFSKTPPAANKKNKTCTDDSSKLEPKENITTNESKKRERSISSPSVKETHSDDEVPIAPKKRRRIRITPLDSDDSDVENKVDNTINNSKEEITTMEKKLRDSFKYESSPSSKSTKQEKSSTNIRPASIPAKPVEEQKIESDEGNWIHCKLDWLKPDKIKDAMKRRPDHPDYDPSTLFVPNDFLKNQTPAHRQWWDMKSSHYDCVLFFKVGKFYELYHMDAAVGVNELGFSYMKGDFAHSGFPESAYGRMASTLVSKGYKVARVEQTETPDMMQERCKKSGQVTKFDKVVRREICQVTLRGTQVCGLQDPGPGEASAAYMMAIAEEIKKILLHRLRSGHIPSGKFAHLMKKIPSPMCPECGIIDDIQHVLIECVQNANEINGCSTYGLCFVDTSIGLFHLGQFVDDKHSSRLLTTLAHYPPALIVYDRKTSTPRTKNLLTSHCHSARREPQNMWPSDKTLKVLAEKYYKTNADGEWPEGIKEFLHEGDALGLTPAANCSLAIKALGGCVSYLTDCLLDIQILGMSQFTSYSPPDVLNKTLSQETKVENLWEGSNTMVLDAITLRNLRIVQDSGCLYDRLNFCSTAMGKRLLYQWVCAPSCNIKVIKERQEALKRLFDNQDVCLVAKNLLTTLPDLERLLAKVHALGNLKRSKQHPDSRAIFYEEKTYSKRKVLDFISVLNGFTAALKLGELFKDFDSGLLRRLTQFRPEGKYPDYRDTLTFFKEAFDQKEAEKEGRILPGVGVDQEYDATLNLIKDIEDELKEYLSEQEKIFRCRLSYVGSDKKRYQIEMPEKAASKAGPEYHLEGTRKGFKRFSTEETKEFLSRMMAAEEQKTTVLKDLSRRIFEKFSSNYEQWETALQCLATLDVLLAFAEFARQQSADICLPDVTFDKERKPFIKIVEGRHPCISMINDFIPNDTSLGTDSDNASLLLLTGPNMGGKSTLMRQVGLLTVLAHLGSYVPAQECSLSLVDRIFTRLGASDDILSGQSTFLVEMNETAAIVRHATVHSLVLLDELGRGTSTYDGTAIASGVCVELAERECRTLFSTHYHSLVHHLASHPGVQLGHMACMVETDESTADSDERIPEETITFLYKLSPGACPKSYGFNAARLAGIPKEITLRAHRISKNLEREATCVRAFRNIMKLNDANCVRELLANLVI